MEPVNLRPTQFQAVKGQAPVAISSSSSNASNPIDSASSKLLSFPILEVNVPTSGHHGYFASPVPSNPEVNNLELEPLPLPLNYSTASNMDFGSNLSQCSIVSDDEVFKASIEDLLRYDISPCELSDELLGL